MLWCREAQRLPEFLSWTEEVDGGIHFCRKEICYFPNVTVLFSEMLALAGWHQLMTVSSPHGKGTQFWATFVKAMKRGEKFSTCLPCDQKCNFNLVMSANMGKVHEDSIVNKTILKIV